MRRLLLVTVALSLVIIAALPSAVSAQVCNPYTQGAWAAKAPVNTTVVRAWGIFYPGNGNFYTMGGRADDTNTEILNPREYNPTTNLWATKAAAYPTNLVNNMVGGLLNIGGTDLIVTVGGSVFGGTQTSSDVITYNPVTDTLTVMATDPWPGNPPGGNNLPGGAAVLNNKLYVFGGFNNPVGMIDTVWVFDPAQPAGSRWTQNPNNLPAPRGYIPVAASGNFIYLFGGSDFPGGLLVDTTDSLRFDPATETFTTVATIPRATAETRAVRQQFDNTIWVLGGGRTAPNPSAEVDVYNPATNTWTTAPSMLGARRNFPADTDPADGRIWVAGGYDFDGVTPLNVNDQFTCGACEASVQVKRGVHIPGSTLRFRIHIAHNRPETVTVPWEMTLIDAQGRVVAKHTTQPHTFEPGDVVDKDVEFRLPDDLASGTYTVRLAISGMAGTKGATTSFRVVAE
jgi:N-acetylneuraminic acid mutarotase